MPVVEQGGKKYWKNADGSLNELPADGGKMWLPMISPTGARTTPAGTPTASAYPEYQPMSAPTLLETPDIKTMREQFAANLSTDLAKGLRQGQDIYARRGVTGSGEETRYFGQAQEGYGRALAGEESNLQSLLQNIKGQNVQTQNVFGQNENIRKSAYDIAKFNQRKNDLTTIINTLKDQAVIAKPGDPIRDQYNRAVSELLGIPYTPETATSANGQYATGYTAPGLPVKTGKETRVKDFDENVKPKIVAASSKIASLNPATTPIMTSFKPLIEKGVSLEKAINTSIENGELPESSLVNEYIELANDLYQFNSFAGLTPGAPDAPRGTEYWSTVNRIVKKYGLRF